MAVFESLRVIDTGTDGARRNIAMSAAIAELHGAGDVGDTLRIYRYAESVLVGRNQILGDVVDVAYCQSNGIELARRVTGGGAVYMEPGALAWDLFVTPRAAGSQLDRFAETVCNASAAALTRMGLAASYRAPSDVVVDARKISGCSGSFDGATLFLQGTMLIDTDFATMAKALIVPGVEVHDRAPFLSKRLVSLADLLRELPSSRELEESIIAAISGALDRHVHCRVLTADEVERCAEMLAQELGTETFVQGSASDNDVRIRA